MSDKNEFTFLNYNIVDLCIFYSIFLVLWGVAVSFLSGSNSITSFIPSILAVPVLLFSFTSKMFPSKQKLFMHIVVMFILIIFLGGLDFLRNFFSHDGMGSIWASSSKFMMLLSGGFFLYLCVMSFKYARKNASN